MKIRIRFIVVVLVVVGIVFVVQVEMFKFVFQGILNLLDFYSLNEIFILLVFGNIYEGLICCGLDFQIEFFFVECWEIIEFNCWWFYFCKGVKFYNGSDFIVEDVVFFVDCVKFEGFDFMICVFGDVKVEIVDDYIVDFVLIGFNLILYYEWDMFYIMDKEWMMENDVVNVMFVFDIIVNYVMFNVNGIGFFKLVSYELSVKIVYEKFDGWWDIVIYNLDSVEFILIGFDVICVVVLFFGEIDMVYLILFQDIKCINDNIGMVVFIGLELCIIFFGMDQFCDELFYFDVKGINLFKDVWVCQVFYKLINIEVIKQKVMWNLVILFVIMILLFLFFKVGEFECYVYDLDGVKVFLVDVGYFDGFLVGMDCLNDCYVNDEVICQVVVVMFVCVGIKVDLNVQLKVKYFVKILVLGGYDIFFYLFGWILGFFDSWNIFDNLMNCWDESGKGFLFNNGGFCDVKIDELIDQILVEIDLEKCDQLIVDVYKIVYENVYYILLYQQGLVWGVLDKLDVVQCVDNQFQFWFVIKNQVYVLQI